VAFAEVEKFLDTPVKRYSSGMYVRLAFAVAAHLEPEILIVDEVLAVGDAQFQKKCLGKMEDVADREGRIFLFVIHNMVATRSLCTIGIFLEKGQVSVVDSVNQVTAEYLKRISTNNPHSSVTNLLKPKNAPLWIESATLFCSDQINNQISIGDNLGIELKYRAEFPVKDPKIGLVIYSDQGDPLVNANNHYQKNKKSLENSVLSGTIFCD
jgi:lipopolysaccharide transport system ATP-binding protein